jgi:5-(carboxyamino)imidazole ribonucleotide mutase
VARDSPVVLNTRMAAKAKIGPQVGIIMGSTSDWKTMEAAALILKEFGVAYETNVVSAHRTPHWLAEYAASAKGRGLQVIIAGAGGAAHLPGMAAAFTTLPVLGVPVESKALKGLDSLLSIAQMPAGVPVGTLAIGEPGAKNAALLAISILSLNDVELRKEWEWYRAKQTSTVMKAKLPPIKIKK